MLSLTSLPKHDLNKNSSNKHVKVDVGRTSATKECQEQVKQSSSGKSTPIRYLILHATTNNNTTIKDKKKKKESMNLKESKGRDYGKVQREERERGIDVIIISRN